MRRNKGKSEVDLQ